MLRWSTVLAGAVLIGAGSGALAQDVRYLASNCANCHGTDGRGDGATVPRLAGQPATYFIEQMRAFREGRRSATVMHQIAKGYTDDELARLAAFFARQSQ